MTAHARSAFPPIWDPPPRVGYGEEDPGPRAIRDALRSHKPAPWVADLYFNKHWRLAGKRLAYYGGTDIEYTIACLSNRPTIDQDLRAAYAFHAERDPKLSAADRSRLQEALDKIPPNDESVFFEQ